MRKISVKLSANNIWEALIEVVPIFKAPNVQTLGLIQIENCVLWKN